MSTDRPQVAHVLLIVTVQIEQFRASYGRYDFSLVVGHELPADLLLESLLLLVLGAFFAGFLSQLLALDVLFLSTFSIKQCLLLGLFARFKSSLVVFSVPQNSLVDNVFAAKADSSILAQPRGDPLVEPGKDLVAQLDVQWALHEREVSQVAEGALT